MLPFQLSPWRRRFQAPVLSLVLLLGLIAATGGQAAVRDFYFASLGSERGLAQNSVTAMVQDAQGFVWVGTQGGLHRYDGQRYQAWRHDPRDPESLPESLVTALAVDGTDALWVGFYSRFVARIDLSSGRIERFEAAADAGQASQQVSALLPVDGRLWVGTLEGLQQFDPATGERRRVLALDPRELRANPRQQLLVDRAGVLWYATGVGLYRVDADGARRVGPPVVTRSLLLDRDGRLWVGRADGLFRVDGNGEPVPAWQADDGSSGSNVRAIVQAPDDRLWLSIQGGGLLRFDPGSGASRRIRSWPGVKAGLAEDSISTLMVDRGGMMWVGGQSRGVAVVDPRGARFGYLVDLRRGDDRTGGDSVRAIHEGADGALWIGTDEARLLRHVPGQDDLEDWTAHLPPAATPTRVMAMAGAGHGRIWLATTSGLLRLTPEDGGIESIDLGRFTRTNLRAMAVDRNGDLWLGTLDSGVLHYQRRRGRVVRYGHGDGNPSGLAHPTVHALLEDRRGRIWIGTGDGLDLLEPSSGRLHHFRHQGAGAGQLPGNLIRSLHEGPDGTVWIGTQSGLARVEEDAEGGIVFGHPLAATFNDRPPPAIFSISGGRERGGALWLGTDVGVIGLDPATHQVRQYGLADGLQDLEFNGGAATVLADGRIALGGVRGVNLFDLARMRRGDYVAPLRLLSASIGAQAPDDADPSWHPTRLALPHDAALLRLRIGALDFAPAARPRYRYQLEGFDPGWIENGHRPDITYTRLPPGDYTFRAQTSGRDGRWNPRELRLPVHVATPPWRHPAALAAMALALIALVATLGWRWHRRRQQEQEWFRQIRDREERLNLALWASGEQFWDYHLGSRELHRIQVEASSGSRPEIALHSHVSSDSAIHEEDLPKVRERMLRHLQGGVPLFVSEHRTRTAPGEPWRWVRARGRVVEHDPEGRARRVAGTARDITDSRSTEHELRISGEVLRSMAEAVAVFDDGFRFVSVNPAFERMTGYREAEVVGRPTSLLDSGQHDPRFYQRLRDELRRDGRWSGELWQQRKDGHDFLCSLQGSVVADGSDRQVHYVSVLGDITDQKRAEQELRYLANYDTLTNLPNRTLLSQRLSRAVGRAREEGRQVAVLFLDLDRFKDINDSLGHAAGDRILREAAQRLRQSVDSRNTVARLSGDEFTVVLEDLVDAGQAEQVARELLEAFEAPLQADERHDVVVSPSIGIAVFPDHARSPSDLLKHADTAMYQAKAIGRRTFMRYADSMDIHVRRRATISAALRRVLDAGELSLAFQPRLSLAQDRIVGVEALLRWHSAEYGDIGPSEFIPLAEENGLILEIGEWALRQACDTLQRWHGDGQRGLSVSVNVSALQLSRGHLPSVVSRALADSGLAAEHLELELTESVVMANAAGTAATLQELRALGVRLAVDDFGTGYSSLSYLRRLPIDTLKIDKEFVDDLDHGSDDAAITSAIITMAHSLGLTVVAEGVEEVTQLEFLRDHGCDEIQGYWLARPMPADACLAFLRERQPSAAPVTG